MKPMVSSITTIRNYPRRLRLHPALLSCIRADFPLFKLKSHDKSMKKRKWRVCRKAGRKSSKAPRGHSWTVVIGDITGNTTITRMRGAKISHKTCKYPNRGEGVHLHLLRDILATTWGELVWSPWYPQSPPSQTTHVVLAFIPHCFHAYALIFRFSHSNHMIRV